MRQFLEYFEGISWRDGRFHVASTNIDITLNRALFVDAWRVLKIYLYFQSRKFTHIFKRPKFQGTIAFHPQNPAPWYNIWQIARLAQLKTISDIRTADIVFVFEDKTYSEVDISDVIATSKPVINARIDDNSKTRVAEVFRNVFGYDLEIDPTIHEGLAIRKSDSNGTHDGIVINCPIPKSDVIKGQCYQKLVDSTFNGQTSEDLRVAHALGELALVYHKHKPLNDRFGTHYLSVDVREPAAIFSPQEINNIKMFCDAMHLDFGAIDIMRDKHDGRIYIVDVNKTCMPVLCLKLKEQIACQQIIADALNRGIARLTERGGL